MNYKNHAHDRYELQLWLFVETGSIGDYFIMLSGGNASMVSPVTPVEG